MVRLMPTRSELWRSLRDLVRRPLLVIAIVLPLAMATAVSAALFSVADGLLLRPLPFPQSARLVSIALPKDERRLRLLTSILADPAARRALGERLQSVPILEARAISTPTPYFDPREAATAHVRGTAVSTNFFEMFGLKPKLGRTLDSSDAVTAMSKSPVPAAVPVLIGHALWQSLEVTPDSLAATSNSPGVPSPSWASWTLASSSLVRQTSGRR